MNGHEKTIEKIFRYGFTHNSLDAPISWKNHSVRKNTPHAKPDMYKYTRFYYRSNRKKYLEEEEYEIYILSKILKDQQLLMKIMYMDLLKILRGGRV